MRSIFFTLFLIASVLGNAQNLINWDGAYQLQLSDFQSPATRIGQGNIYSLQTASSIDFAYSMSNAEFMFTKNFNTKVNCSFKRNAAVLVAPDSTIASDLLDFARFEFDLSELYARKFRKRLNEEKELFSDPGYFMPIYNEIQKEYTERHTQAASLTDMGRNKAQLTKLHNEVKAEIQQLSDYCKLCKPPKKNKQTKE